MQIALNRIRRHKRHFQLLELMVAAFILLICIAPTMRIFTSIYQSQQEIIRQNNRDHLAHLIHAKFIEQLYKRNIPLPEAKQSNLIVLSDPEVTQLLQQLAYKFQGEFTLMTPIATTSGKPKKSIGKLVIQLEDTRYKPTELENKKSDDQNQNPAVTFYDYCVCIESKKIEANGPDQNQPTTPQAPGQPSQTAAIHQEETEDDDEDDLEDDEDDDEDDLEDDEDDDDKPPPFPRQVPSQITSPVQPGKKPFNGKKR